MVGERLFPPQEIVKEGGVENWDVKLVLEKTSITTEKNKGEGEGGLNSVAEK